MNGRITLGLMIDQLVSGYARLIIDGVSSGSRTEDANLIVFSGRVLGTPRGHEYQNNVIFDYIRKGTIDALVMATGTQISYISLDQLRDSMRRFEGIPLVSIGARMEGVPSVLPDNRAGVLEAMDHLVDAHGLRRIAFLKGPESNQDAVARFAAYREALHARGLEDSPDMWIQGDFTQEGARQALSRYFGRHPRPDFQALLTANDEMAIAATQIFREHDCFIPRDVSLIGFDDIPDSQFVVPSLTTIGQSLFEQGRRAAAIAAGLARGGAAPAEVVLPTKLVLRTSCGCLPRAVAAHGLLSTAPGGPRGSAVNAETIVDRCIARLDASQTGLSDADLRGMLKRLIDTAGTDKYLRVLQAILNEEVVGRIDIAPWQSLLTSLQGELIEAARSADEVARLHASFQKALALLSDMLRLEQGKRLSELQGHLTQLRRMMERLISVASMDELMNDLAEELDHLDIPTCFIACYPEEIRHHRRDPWVIPLRAEVTLTRIDGKRAIPAEGERFFAPAERFVPRRFLPAERRYTLIATATFFCEDQIGYIAFEPGQRDSAIYETFCVQLSNVLEGSLLFGARQRMVDALARERALMAILMDTIPDRIYFKDEDSRFILINRSQAKAFGVGDPDRAIGKTDFDFFTPEHAQPAFDAEQAIIRSGQAIVDLEEKETWTDGRVTWVSTTKMPLLGPNGELIGTFGLSKDITERRRSEEKILRLAALVESSRDAIFGVDMQDLVTSWNRGAEKVYGYSAEEMVGAPVSLLMTTEDREETRPRWDQVRNGQVIQPFESTGRKKDGASVSLSYALAPIREQQGKIVGFAIIARDMTNEKALQARLIQAQRLENLGTLARGIAHHFNNINAIIKGYLDAVMGSPDISPTTRLYGGEALKGVQRLVDITERLQGLTVDLKVGEESCRLSELARSVLPRFEKRFEERGVSVVLELRDTPPVRIHRSRAVYILTCLVGNSLDSLLDRPVRTLTIRTGIGPKSAYLEVIDAGCGIPREDIPRLFTPFFTTKGEWAASDSPQARVEGVGLSLSICRSTVSESGGRIEVESEPGVGSTFRVWFPTLE